MKKTATTATTATTTTTNIKPEQLPVDLGGGDIQYVGRTDYCKRTASTYAIKLGAKLTKDHVQQMIEQLDRGNRELPGDSPEEVAQLFDAVIADYDAGSEHVREQARLKKEAEENEARAKKEKQEVEDKLLAVVGKKSMDLSELSKKFDTGHMDRFVPKGEVSNEELLTAFKSSMGLEGFSDWMQGDLIVELEKRGLENVVTKLTESAGKSYVTLYRKARTAKAFPPDQRREGVSFTIYSEIATTKFSDEEMKAVPALLKDVQDGKHNSQTVRAAVNAIKGKDHTVVAPEDSDKVVFIVIPLELLRTNGSGVYLHKGFPKELLSEYAVVNPKTNSRFTSMTRKPENRWDELPAYEAPAEPAKKKGKK